MGGFHVVIAGGGIAAIEGLLRLRTLAADSVQIIMVAPNDKFVYRPLLVTEALGGFGEVFRYPLADVAKDTGATWIKDSLVEVDFESRTVRTEGNQSLSYDALLLAIGGRQQADIENVLVFRDAEAGEIFERVAEDLEDGHARSVAFILSEGPTYPLPIYELALMTAERARAAGVEDRELFLLTPEPAPLAAFGSTAQAVVTGRLMQAGVKLYTTATAFVPAAGELLVQPHGVDLTPDRIVVVPRITGPRIRGVPSVGAYGFIPIDRHCTVPQSDRRVFAAGDAVAYPVKHGGLGAQQADTAAAAIAQLAGVPVEAAPFRAEIRGKLLTGREPLYLSGRLTGAQGFDSEVVEAPPWLSDHKVLAEELGPYVARLAAR